MSTNVELVKSAYAAFARGDIAAVLNAMGGNMVWNEAENSPYADGNPYIGPESVLHGVFERLAEDWEGFFFDAHEISDAGDTIVSLGRYGGVCKATGASINAQFAHVWRVEGGKLARYQQYADTLQMARALGG